MDNFDDDERDYETWPAWVLAIVTFALWLLFYGALIGRWNWDWFIRQ